MSRAGERPEIGEPSEDAPAHATDKRTVLCVAAILWLLAAWPLFFLESLPHQDLPGHVAGAYVVDHIAQYPEYVAAHGFRTNSAFPIFVSATASRFGYMGAARVFLLVLLAVNALGYTLLLDSLGGAKRVWLGGSFAAPFVHHWFVSMGMLNFSLSFGLCLWILSQQKALRERWSYPRAALVLALSVMAWVAHNFPLLVLMLMAFAECLEAAVRRRSNWAGSLRWACALVPAGLLVVGGTLLAPVREYTSIPGVGRAVWENVGDLVLGMFRHFVLGPSFWSGAAIITGLSLIAVACLNRTGAEPPGFSGTALVLLALCYAFVPASVIPVWSYFGTRFVPFIWVALLARVPDRLPARVFPLLCAVAVASSLGSGAAFLRMDHELEDFRSGVPSVPRGARVLPLMFSVNSPGDFIEPFMHAWAHYTVERGTSADMVWASRSVDDEYYVKAPPPEFQHDAIGLRARTMYSADAWCGKLLRYTNTMLTHCPEQWQADWHSYMNDASKRYSYVLVWDAPEKTLAVIARHFEIVHRRGKLVVGKLNAPTVPGPPFGSADLAH